MNAYAARLGLEDTSFVNATGLPDPKHYTTAYDIALLSRAMIREFPQEYQRYAQREFTYNDIKQYNRNRLLWRDDAVDGIKTGFTQAARYCLAASSARKDMRLISVVMGADSPRSRMVNSQALLNYGFRHYEITQAVPGGPGPFRAAYMARGVKVDSAGTGPGSFCSDTPGPIRESESCLTDSTRHRCTDCEGRSARDCQDQLQG